MAKKSKVVEVKESKVSLRAYDVIKGPLITEKSNREQQLNKYTVRVAKDANKVEIKLAFETIFKVKVSSVNIVNTNSRSKRVGQRTGIIPGFKKAIVTLEADSVLDIANVA